MQLTRLRRSCDESKRSTLQHWLAGKEDVDLMICNYLNETKEKKERERHVRMPRHGNACAVFFGNANNGSIDQKAMINMHRLDGERARGGSEVQERYRRIHELWIMNRK